MSLTVLGLLLAGGVASSTSLSSMTTPPANYERSLTTYDWCDCNTGLANITVFGDDQEYNITVSANSTTWIRFPAGVRSVEWQCDHMKQPVSSGSVSEPSSLWSVQLTPAIHSWPCDRSTGRIKWNTWKPSQPGTSTSVPLSSMQHGYACLKIPVLLRTANNTLLAFAEGRKHNCSDFAATELVYRRSTDLGVTWSKLTEIATPSTAPGLCGNSRVVGNAAPVQLSAESTHPHRILLPHMHNNYDTWITHSDDDGLTWSVASRIPVLDNVTSSSGPDCDRNMSYFGVSSSSSWIDLIRDLGWGVWDPYQRWHSQLTGAWQFIGIGPPGSISLQSNPNKVLVPGYHAYIRGLTSGAGAAHGAGAGLPVSQLYNNVAFGHLMISDDAGDTWRLSEPTGFGAGLGHGANEAQLAELSDGSILVNSRSLSTGTAQLRVQAISRDHGETFSATSYTPALPEPFGGCAGSMISAQNGSIVYFSHPDPSTNHAVAPWILRELGAKVNLTGRDHMTIWSSADAGTSYQKQLLVDSGAAGYSSLQLDQSGDALWLLYEQSDPPAEPPSELGLEALIGSLTVFDPDRLVLRRIALNSTQSPLE